MKIEALQLPNFTENISGKRASTDIKGTTSFKDILKDSINKANELEKVADQEVQKLAKLDSQDIHTTMIAIEKADLTFQTMMQIRNKIINAYEEIMRMQV
ncbi:MAG TPA: flagellar hook-basal body complex protein FliE [Syntrophorhabdaceae bacterium]|jgi:flagellar hook-basal body complex protein FliE|nr:flagellar hook-basal body complex protein FliE [Syntrophorhabdaceae bacterium]MDI9562527.1 flagellar hook-basal body complex protein FliE [Pseudomonadota bacterium]OQC48691.1 MAG: flagellar hook-basal body protein FliE [Deltaproteobacteria bacterium ADurb.Bin026]HNQ63488.1 flagellar hook-basal body complex protein FliE [Syntrophorhabdaceae bacterium]HOG39576.1 flagellar hook-basal body complex protein FliE [Syntrophorhabdaceae bacterium]